MFKSLRGLSLALIVLSFLACSPGAGEKEMTPFVMDWRDNDHSLIDLSFLYDGPAGKDGPISVRDGHLVKPDGTRFRIWGINITAAACFPSKEAASSVAAYMARFGINCVRFHFLDTAGPGSIFGMEGDSTRSLDPGQLDKLDYFIAQLKKKGIYSTLGLNNGRMFRKNDGVLDYEFVGLAKILPYFDPHIQNLHKEYAGQLLSHFNPYTKSQYSDEPAVLSVELLNENSIVDAWQGRRLDGTNNTSHESLWRDHKSWWDSLGKIAWVDITPSYARQLTGLYNDWLRDNLSLEEMSELRRICRVGEDEIIPRLLSDQISSANRKRFHWEESFYMELETKFFTDMYKYLKNDLGIKSLIVATADNNHWKSGYPFLTSASQMDIVDGHNYWQHPRLLTVQGSPVKRFGVQNTPMVSDPLYSTVVQLSRSAVAGKPYTVSEINHPFPSEYGSEGIGILAAYGAFHDWDGIYIYTFEHVGPRDWEAMNPDHFAIRADPVKMTNMAAGALIFLRGDVKAARETIHRSYSREQVLDSFKQTLTLETRYKTFFTPGFSPALPLLHSTRIKSFEEFQDSYPQVNEESPLVTDTGEIVWEYTPPDNALVSVKTNNSQALIGFVKNNPKILANMSAVVDNEFCSIVLTSLDGQPIARAENLLLVAASRSANTGQKWEEDRRFIVEWGTAPTVIEPVSGMIKLRNLEGAQAVEAQPMDGGGKALGRPIQARKVGDGFEITAGSPATTWYLIKVIR